MFRFLVIATLIVVSEAFMAPLGGVRSQLSVSKITMQYGGKGFGGGEATRDPEPTVIDANDPKGKWASHGRQLCSGGGVTGCPRLATEQRVKPAGQLLHLLLDMPSLHRARLRLGPRRAQGGQLPLELPELSELLWFPDALGPARALPWSAATSKRAHLLQRHLLRQDGFSGR